MDLHDEWIYSSRKYINFDKEMVKHCIAFYTGSGLDSLNL